MSYKYNGVDITEYLSNGTTSNEGYNSFPGTISNYSVISQYAPDIKYYKDTNINIVANKICKYADYTTSSNGQIVPSWCNKVRVLMIGAGGGGGTGGAGQTNTDGSWDGVGSGGGGGACGMVCVFQKSVLPSSSYNVSIGTGGSGGTYSYEGGNSGGAGNSTTFTSGTAIATVYGGNGGNKGGSRYGNNGSINEGNGGNIASETTNTNYTAIVSITNNSFNLVNTNTGFTYSIIDNFYQNAASGNKGTQKYTVDDSSGGIGGSGGYLKTNDFLGNYVNYGKGGTGGNGWNGNTAGNYNDGGVAGTNGFVRVYFFRG